MKVWALADPHLSFGTPNKSMDVFGEKWHDHEAKIVENCQELVSPEDLLLIAGDISWAKHIEEAKPDLEWVASLPGTKVISKGNHDYWWPSNKKIEAILPPSVHFVNKSAIDLGDFSIAGTRLWDHRGVDFSPFIDFCPNPRATHPEPKTAEEKEHDEKIYKSELQRLEIALQGLTPGKRKIAMVHYPPLNHDLTPSPVSELLEKYGVEICVFGHIHNLKSGVELFNSQKGGVHYFLTSCDYLAFRPQLCFSSSSQGVG